MAERMPRGPVRRQRVDVLSKKEFVRRLPRSLRQELNNLHIAISDVYDVYKSSRQVEDADLAAKSVADKLNELPQQIRLFRQCAAALAKYADFRDLTAETFDSSIEKANDVRAFGAAMEKLAKEAEIEVSLLWRPKPGAAAIRCDKEFRHRWATLAQDCTGRYLDHIGAEIFSSTINRVEPESYALMRKRDVRKLKR